MLCWIKDKTNIINNLKKKKSKIHFNKEANPEFTSNVEKSLANRLLVSNEDDSQDLKVFVGIDILD